MLKRKLARGGAIALTLAISVSLFAGCAGKEKGATSEQVIKFNINSEPKTIDPALNTGVNGGTIIVNSFEGLTRLDKNDKAIPGVAEKWDISENGLTYTFHLRKDAKWSDEKDVKAQDFEYAWKRALKPETASEYAYQMYYLKNGEKYNAGNASADDVGVKAKDDYTLEVTLENPTAYFLPLLAFPTYAPVREDMVSKDPQGWARKPETYISNGAFKMKEWKPKDTITFVKNDQYWNKDSIKLEKIEYKMIENETSALAAFKAGQLDYIKQPPAQEIPKLLEDGIAKIYPNLGTYFYCLNVSDNLENVNPEAKVLKDTKIRKALALAINRTQIVENVTKGGQLPATSYVPNGIPKEDGKDFKEKDYFKAEGDVEEAKKLLAEAGYPDGKGFPTLTIMYNTNEGHQNVAQAVQDMWRKNLGINIELKNQEWKVFQKTRTSKNYEIARHGWVGDYVDPMTFLDMWVTGGGNNDAGYSNPEYDKLIKAAKSEIDAAKRMEYLTKAENILMSEMPIIPIYYYTDVICLNNNIKELQKSPLGFVLFDNTYIEAVK
ncbi:peptide ABC transporter substrate-binding protein [Clostridium aestuarii]|uniref:Peptide ABC transporter substrate-binding protein n=1 Tax=Clostridium aestuarii TaxID=338193 RepID=A0ABT4CXW0_9CLOT|nr:peptide ABC transporter substrate-binding protein [Clostridium aestuarii]MCY6482785.1 peptide ABC transporter substrate-binding protein [Clostridium aestuarii]